MTEIKSALELAMEGKSTIKTTETARPIEKSPLTRTVHSELQNSYAKFVGSVVKRVRKDLKLARLSSEQIREIAEAFKSFRPGDNV